jgi:hypothetical protein
VSNRLWQKTGSGKLTVGKQKKKANNNGGVAVWQLQCGSDDGAAVWRFCGVALYLTAAFKSLPDLLPKCGTRAPARAKHRMAQIHQIKVPEYIFTEENKTRISSF